MSELTCTSCGSRFNCGADEGQCWCMSYPPVLSVEGESCLCPKCMGAKIANAKDQEPQGS